MLLHSFVRIAGVAVVFFAVPALVIAATESIISSIRPTGSVAVFGVAIAAILVAGTLRILGPIAYAAFLDRAVAAEYVDGHHRSLGEVMRTLPWRTLVAADLGVTLIVGVGLGFFVIPGFVLYGLLGLIGPVVVQERRGLSSSFRRTVGLARRAPALVTLLVVIPFAFDELLHALIAEALHSYGLGVEVLVEWVVAIVVGGTLGLLEVALATELMARSPLEAAVPGRLGPT